MKMRELEGRTGVNRETIRVYFREGLLPEPSRPARNVADYGDEHVRAVMAVRSLQRESALTLPQIKAMLNGEGADRSINVAAFTHLEELVAGRVGVKQGHVAIETLLEANPKAAVDARSLAKIGIIDLVQTPDGPALSLTDAGLVNIWARMRAHGFDEEHGFPPELLSYYIEAADYVAGNEAKLFLERVEGRMPEDEAATMLEFALPAMLDFFGIIRQKAFLRFIADKTKQGRDIPVVAPGRKRKAKAPA